MAKIVRTKLFDWLLTFLSVGMAVVLFVSAYWAFAPYKIIEWKITNYEMQKKDYKIGEPLTFRSAFCKKGNYSATVLYQIEDGVTYFLTERTSKSGQGCLDFISSTFETPNIPAGEYRLKGTITYKVNPFREVTYVMYSNTFNIINNQ